MKDYDIKRIRMQNKLDEYFGSEDLSTVSKNKIDEFVRDNLRSISRSSYYDSIRILNDILEDNKNDVRVKSSDMVEELVNTRTNEYFTMSEIMNICYNLENFQDKCMIYLMWLGVRGGANEDLRMIKVEDIADDLSYIKIGDKKLMCDNFLRFLLDGALRQSEYIKLVDKNVEDVFIANWSYPLNINSPYLFRTKVTSTTNNGCKPLTNVNLMRRLAKLEVYYEQNMKEKIHLNPNALVKSGVMHKMYEMEKKYKVVFDIPRIEIFLKENGYNMNSASLYRIYQTKYHGRTHINKK